MMDNTWNSVEQQPSRIQHTMSVRAKNPLLPEQRSNHRNEIYPKDGMEDGRLHNNNNNTNNSNATVTVADSSVDMLTKNSEYKHHCR
jgi:hypothetical protein